MEAVITRIVPGDEIEVCGIEGCSENAAYHLLKMRDDSSVEERLFCETHGREYAQRGHLAIAENN
jgi:hypothetical protein